MWFHDEQLRILKDLFIEHKNEPTKETFFKIVQRIDPLLGELVGRFSKTYYYLEPTPQLLQDMYQVSISSLEKAVKDFRPSASPSAIPSWIFHVVRNELFREFGVKKFDVGRYIFEHPQSVEKPDIDFNLVREDINNIVEDLIEKEEISKEDFDLFVLAKVEQIPINEILRTFPDKWGKSWETLRNKVVRTHWVLKREFIKNGFEHA